eukprot:8266841-Pyramimonas_sp.AAC.2
MGSANLKNLKKTHLSIEVGVHQEGGQLGVGVVGAADAVQELRADDAPALPDAGHLAQPQVPALGLGLGADQVHALRVAAHLGCVQRRLHVLHQLR